MTIKDRINQLRVGKDISEAELERQVHFSKGYLSRVTDKSIGIYNLFSLADFFEVDPRIILKDETRQYNLTIEHQELLSNYDKSPLEFQTQFKNLLETQVKIEQALRENEQKQIFHELIKKEVDENLIKEISKSRIFMTPKDRIQKLATENGWSQNELIRKLDLNISYLSTFDTASPNAKKFFKIADYLEVDPRYIFTGEVRSNKISVEQQELLNNYEKLPLGFQKHFREYLKLYIEIEQESRVHEQQQMIRELFKNDIDELLIQEVSTLSDEDFEEVNKEFAKKKKKKKSNS